MFSVTGRETASATAATLTEEPTTDDIIVLYFCPSDGVKMNKFHQPPPTRRVFFFIEIYIQITSHTVCLPVDGGQTRCHPEVLTTTPLGQRAQWSHLNLIYWIWPLQFYSSYYYHFLSTAEHLRCKWPSLEEHRNFPWLHVPGNSRLRRVNLWTSHGTLDLYDGKELKLTIPFFVFDTWFRAGNYYILNIILLQMATLVEWPHNLSFSLFAVPFDSQFDCISFFSLWHILRWIERQAQQLLTNVPEVAINYSQEIQGDGLAQVTSSLVPVSFPAPPVPWVLLLAKVNAQVKWK